MTRIFDEDGRSFAVTLVKALPCKISQLKNTVSDGYKSVQVTVYKKEGDKEKILKKAEFRVDNPGKYKVGDEINLKQFKKDELVTVVGTSKGKGFAGTVKRHKFARGPETHGSNNVREPGSIGGGYPERVVKGRRMPGHLGVDTVTVKNLKIADLDKDILLICGSIPGPNKSVVRIFGKGEKAEEIVDSAAIEEQMAMQKMLEDDKEKKEEKVSEKPEEIDNSAFAPKEGGEEEK